MPKVMNSYLWYTSRSQFLFFLSAKALLLNKLFFASKSTNEGPFVKYFKDIFNKIYNDEQIENIKKKIIRENVTFVFEVIDPINDPHIIEYKESKIVLLDITKSIILRFLMKN